MDLIAMHSRGVKALHGGDFANFGNQVDCCMSTFTNEGESSELVLERCHKYPVATNICVLRNHDNRMLLYTLSH